MEIIKHENGKVLELEVLGHINASSAPELESAVKEECGKYDKIVFDFYGVEYISSAGLRVILYTHKTMASKGGSFVIKNLRDDVRAILEMTGFLGFIKVI